MEYLGNVLPTEVSMDPFSTANEDRNAVIQRVQMVLLGSVAALVMLVAVSVLAMIIALLLHVLPFSSGTRGLIAACASLILFGRLGMFARTLPDKLMGAVWITGLSHWIVDERNALVVAQLATFQGVDIRRPEQVWIGSRATIQSGAKILGAAIIETEAWISSAARLGDGAWIGKGARLRGACRLAHQVHVGAHASVLDSRLEDDVRIDSFAHISGCVLHQGVHVEEGIHLVEQTVSARTTVSTEKERPPIGTRGSS